MNTIVPGAAPEISAAPTSEIFGKDLYMRWLSFLDVKPATLATYSKAIRLFFLWLSEHGIDRTELYGRSEVVLPMDGTGKHLP